MINFKITTLFCASLFFAKQAFCADLPLAVIEDIGTPEQIETLTRTFENVVMRSETTITRRMRKIGSCDNRDDYIKIHFRNFPHLQAIIGHVPELKTDDEKIVFVFDQNAPDDYRQAIRTHHETFLTYDEFFHIASSGDMQISGQIDAPGKKFVFSTPSNITAQISCAELKTGELSLDSKLKHFLIMHAQMTFDDTSWLSQRFREELARPTSFPFLEDNINGFIVGEGLSYTGFNSVNVDGSFILAASNMEMLLTLQEDFKYVFARTKINLIQEGYNGVACYARGEPLPTVGMLIESQGSMLVYNTASAFSREYNFIYKSGGDMYVLGSNSGKYLTFNSNGNLWVASRPENINNVFGLFIDLPTGRTLPGFSVFNGNARKLSPAT